MLFRQMEEAEETVPEQMETDPDQGKDDTPANADDGKDESMEEVTGQDENEMVEDTEAAQGGTEKEVCV